MNIWNYYHDIGNFETLSAERQDEIITVMMSAEAASNWNYSSVLSALFDHIDADMTFKFIGHYLDHATPSYDGDASFRVIQKAYDKCKDKAAVKDLVRNCKSKKIHRSLLVMEDITDKDEELGLRSLSAVKYAPDDLYVRKYTPGAEAMKNLPPVTRLKVLETLLTNDNIAYNLFVNFTDPDEFKSLLFGAVLRHRDRSEYVWEKYNEIIDLGKEATVVVAYDCPNCGECSISLKSTRARTSAGLDNTRLGGFLNRRACPLCGRWGDSLKKSFTCAEG